MRHDIKKHLESIIYECGPEYEAMIWAQERRFMEIEGLIEDFWNSETPKTEEKSLFSLVTWSFQVIGEWIKLFC